MRVNPVYFLLGIASVYAVPLNDDCGLVILQVNAQLESRNLLDSTMHFQLRYTRAPKQIDIYFPTDAPEFRQPYKFSFSHIPMTERIKVTLERCIGGPAEPNLKNAFVNDPASWDGKFRVTQSLLGH
ncbi:hypothetical protein F5890DRAFT_1478841 [Lentinula detonsa]|uniref:Uncharacterized protein n=1 Tax=Lentinula detonsa TaxID=2804962 RepID=A0AA38PPT7_9AGAR|nr:hypothetical protein F5890DRAFT_1478841 [Lentinula detonsa]